ncbi:response regulator transcription factor [Arthrobacter rhizosphaerae]|uniref:response regulator transcription factor n=1 Tax=Arthrobacter rhizosphaerae TaxID=2855490 RepID=UPI001FF42070|nr:response regulator transcription factor [Arthrobacter rhizosphaerae]
MKPVRVLLADDQALLREGLATMLSVEEDIEVVGQVANGEEAARFAAENDVDVVLMDVQMPVLDGIRATQRIMEFNRRVGSKGSKVIILTTFERDDYLFDALSAGASGFLLKNTDPDDVVAAIHTVADGYALLAPEVTLRVIERFARESSGALESSGGHSRPPARTTVNTRAGDDAQHLRSSRLDLLTNREREVLQGMAKGLSNAELASALFLSEATVKTHVSNLLSKIQVRDRVQAVVFAYECGLILPGDRE